MYVNNLCMSITYVYQLEILSCIIIIYVYQLETFVKGLRKFFLILKIISVSSYSSCGDI